MKGAGIQSRTAKRFVITTDSKHELAPSPDHLQRHFHRTQQDQAWVSDTTFSATRQGWLYLAVVLDLYSRRVIGWSMADKNNRQLVAYALTMTIWRQGHIDNIIVHSDQGSTSTRPS
jgi:putative transposase